MKKAFITLLVVLMAVSAVFAADVELKIGQGFLKSTNYGKEGYEVTTATVGVDLGRLEVGASGSTVFPYAFFSNVFGSGTWASKWSAITAETKTFWALSAYGTFDVVAASQIDLNLGAAVSYRYGKNYTHPHAVTLDAKADATFWLANKVGVYVGFEFPLVEGYKNNTKWEFKYPNSLDQLKKFADTAAITAKAGLTVKL